MNFVQIGEQIINMDQVAHIEVYGNFVHLNFAFGLASEYGEQAPHHVTFSGDEAEAFRRYLEFAVGVHLYVAMNEAEAQT